MPPAEASLLFRNPVQSRPPPRSDNRYFHQRDSPHRRVGNPSRPTGVPPPSVRLLDPVSLQQRLRESLQEQAQLHLASHEEIQDGY